MGIEYMIFVQPGNKYMTSGNKVYGFLTIRKQIYAQWEKIYVQWEKDICLPGKKYMPRGKKIPFFPPKMSKEAL